MRSIAKQGEPRALINWKRSMQAALQNLTYSNIPTEIRDDIKQALLNEQGWLCAYTMCRLNGVETCHIEHVEPQNAAPNRDVDFDNMAACFPKDGGDKSYGYGATVKSGTPVVLNVDFISPHAPGCEHRFRFDDEGHIKETPNDVAAKSTIAMLGLDNDKLVQLRRAAIEANGLTVKRRTTRTTRTLKSAAEARRFAREVMQPDANGQLSAFCTALSMVAQDYADKEDARSRRLRAEPR